MSDSENTASLADLIASIPKGQKPAAYCMDHQQNYVDGWNACLWYLGDLAQQENNGSPSTTGYFNILGDPAQQGSKTRMPNGAMLEGKSATARAKHKTWRGECAAAAADMAEIVGMLDGPLLLDVTFRFAMPASRKKAVREAGECYKQSAPDLDKLIRALGDGMTAGGLVRDDARFAIIYATKTEVTGWTGARVQITRIAE